MIWRLMALLLLTSMDCAAQKGERIGRFTFREFSGGVVLLKVKFEDVPDSLNFILDTGCGACSLDSLTCTEFGISARPTDSVVSGIGGRRRAYLISNRSVNIQGVNIKGLDFYLNDYALLSSVYGIKIDGLLGYNFFKQYVVAIDYEHSVIDLYKPDGFQYPPGGQILRPSLHTIPFEVHEVNDNRRMQPSLYYDSGAGLPLLLSERAVKDSNLLISNRVPVVVQAEGMGGKVQMRLTVLKEFRLGKYKFKNVPAYLYSDHLNILTYPMVHGILGNEIMRRFNVIYNYPHAEIYIKPNKRYNTPFDYSYTGMSFYDHDGKVIVEDIVSGSPADVSGFLSGDEIVGIGINFSGNVQEYKDMINVPDTTLKIAIRRKGALESVLMRTGNILQYTRNFYGRRPKRSGFLQGKGL